MPQSTPLDKIENNDIPDNQASDEERVQRIIQEMNQGDSDEGNSPGKQQPSQYQQQQPQYQPEPQMMQPGMMPSGPMQPGMMHPGMMQPGMMHPGMMHPGMMQPGMMHPGMMQQQGPPEMAIKEQYNDDEEELPAPPVKKNIWAHITDFLKLPLVVSVVFFLLNLPIMDVYLAKYAHWAFSSGGHLSMLGLALKALAAGTIMGLYDTIDKLISRLF